MFRGVRLFDGRFFLRRGQGSLFSCSLKKYSRFISELGAPDTDALPLILQEFYLFSATKVAQNIFCQPMACMDFWRIIATALCGKHKNIICS